MIRFNFIISILSSNFFIIPSLSPPSLPPLFLFLTSFNNIVNLKQADDRFCSQLDRT